MHILSGSEAGAVFLCRGLIKRGWPALEALARAAAVYHLAESQLQHLYADRFGETTGL